jgi:hypothetical protein
MKAIYDELVAKHGGGLDRVRAGMPKKNYVVCESPQQVKEALKTKAESLWLSAEDFAKQLNHHPELTIEEYVSVFNNLKNCDEIRKAKYGRIALMVKDDRYYAALLKTTGNKLESYVVSLYRLDERTLAQFRNLQRVY